MDEASDRDEGPVDPAALAGALRPGAVVSLLTVLGDAGITNGYTCHVWSVVPGIPGGREEVVLDGTRFVFFALPIELLDAPDRDDLFDPSATYARTGPEAALAHWVYLHLTGVVRWLPAELELDDLDMPRLTRISREMGIEREVESYLSGVRNLNNEQQVMPGLGI